MALDASDIVQLIRDALPDAQIEIRDVAGDRDHFAALVSSAAFNGKSRLEQHRMVFDALRGRIGTELHALSIQTRPLPDGA